ncbi:MAG: 50S ribosomal protein L20 [Candidatus Marinimicrobia bacterium]|jgi:large subunit ribosomal protein L20|nr:50S ribosomal protein L20 [Candidatus Neomarinimicrobiota bacterium]MBT3634867.1 50S ribosomal protein L20 [Candidatus Neomarinimicrobiota bacterium]MBT3682771.1 50S ribosomal protein L20 [Candidatus Neomarinimicrobiota bacterium]MBT3759574.1 50S ribosomal protein L20 [Candidatus Neomarinimicrobiota bacterium]MBT3894554.1 50S ribosomal protein L20 [Candidatus Neomarinimicrobiota bacterium]
MPRSNSSVPRHRKHRKLIKQAKGYFGTRKSNYRTAKDAVQRALAYAYRDRRQKKRDFRRLWIIRINAAARMNGMTYSKLIAGLKNNNILLNRKSLAYLAVNDPDGFTEIVKSLS